MSSVTHFEKALLPPPSSFYQQELGQLSRPNGKGWAMGNCPFHASKSRRSLAVNVQSGGWRCFGCDSHGDLVGFVMQRDNCDFQAACKTLGAWKDISEDEQRRIDLQNAQRRRQKEEEARQKQLAHEQLLALRDEIYTDIAIEAEVSARLSELLSGAAPHFPDEVENCWSVLSSALDDLRQCEADYMARAGLEYAG